VPATRSVAVELHEHAEAITAWRNTLPERQRKRLVHPLSVTRRWRASTAHGNGKCPQDLQRDARQARARLCAYAKALPAAQAAPLWQAALTQAAATLGSPETRPGLAVLVDEKGAPPILATRPITAILVTRQISIVAAALAIIVDRSGSGCASRSAIICASMNSPVNPSNAHRRKRATYSGVGFVKGQGHHFLLVTNETRAEPLRTAALR
jgi:hypothetical protein